MEKETCTVLCTYTLKREYVRIEDLSAASQLRARCTYVRLAET